MHVTEPAGAATFAALKAEHSTTAAFALEASRPENLDPESAAKRILAHALASDAIPSLITPKVSGTASDFKSLGVETVPLTGTTVVKFRQQLHGIPIYGSLISVELDDNNDMVSLNSNLAAPDVKSFLARIAGRASCCRGGGRVRAHRPQVVPALNLFLDSKGKWHLAYIAENVHSRKKEASGPLVYDFVVDALTGSLVAGLPRTPSADATTDQALDELGTTQMFCIDMMGTQKVLRDPALNIETYDFGFRDPNLVVQNLPGTPVAPPWSSAAVSAHVNAATVATYLRTVLKRNNIDNKGGRVISSVNCVVKTDESPPGSNVWLNAFWNGTQMIYGQAIRRQAALAGLRSISWRTSCFTASRRRQRASSTRTSPVR